MSVALKIDMPEGAFSALRLDPEGLARELRLAAAAKWYEMGIISQEKAGGHGVRHCYFAIADALIGFIAVSSTFLQKSNLISPLSSAQPSPIATPQIRPA